MALSLFMAGVIYAYNIFFPYAFGFLAKNAVSAGIKPSYGITEFTEFMALLTLSFGLAAQLPLLMGVLSYTEIVPYETFRDKWRHAVVGIVVFGALFSPPDPFTQVMWAMPMVVLYVFSLGLAKVVTNVRRRGAAKYAGTGTTHMKRRLLQFGGVLAVVALGTTAAVNQGGFGYLRESVYPTFPSWLRPSGTGGSRRWRSNTVSSARSGSAWSSRPASGSSSCSATRFTCSNSPCTRDRTTFDGRTLTRMSTSRRSRSTTSRTCRRRSSGR